MQGTLPELHSHKVLFDVEVRQSLGSRVITRKRGESRQSARNRRNPRVTFSIPGYIETQTLGDNAKQRREQIMAEAEKVVSAVKGLVRYKVKIASIEKA